MLILIVGTKYLEAKDTYSTTLLFFLKQNCFHEYKIITLCCSHSKCSFSPQHAAVASKVHVIREQLFNEYITFLEACCSAWRPCLLVGFSETAVAVLRDAAYGALHLLKEQTRICEESFLWSWALEKI